MIQNRKGDYRDSIVDEEVDSYWFERGRSDNPRFWSRFPERPCFAQSVVLDLGCGRGSLCVDMAQAGAKSVVGLDIDPRFIEFARRNLQQNYPELTRNIVYEAKSLKEFQDNVFDIVVSKDSFEHINALPEVLDEVKRCLKPGGKLFAGFGPLYNSFDGHHDLLGRLPPWGHVILPEKWLLRRINRRRSRKASSIAELGLNQLSFAEYRAILYKTGLRVVSFSVNQSQHIASHIFSLMRRIQGLEELFTHNIYVILQKDA